MRSIGDIPASSIADARTRISEAAITTPLLPLDDSERIWLKLECLQPIGSFKIRGAANAMALAEPSSLEKGVYTASAGNMAQGVAFEARRRGLPCRVIVPDSAPRAKTDAIGRLGGTVVPVPYDEWWQVLADHGHPDESGHFVHPVADPAVIAGNGTIGLEILEQLPAAGTVIVPFGGGGLSSGIASAFVGAGREVTVLASEVETSAPFAASLAAGRPVTVDRTPSFVDGIGGSAMLEAMWPLASRLLRGSIVVSLEEIAAAIRELVSSVHVVAEGAGASSVAAALRHAEGETGPIVAVVSGGNIDTEVLRTILAGRLP